MATNNKYTDISSDSETSLPDLGLSPYDDILNDLIYSNGRAKRPSEFSQLHENKDRCGVGTDSEGRSAMTGKPTVAENTKFAAFSNEPKTKLSCNIRKKTDVRKATSCLNLNKCQYRKRRTQSFTDLRQICGQGGCQHRFQDDGLSPGASKCHKMSHTALSHMYWYVINNKQFERSRSRPCKRWGRILWKDKVMLYRHIIQYMEILACTSRGVSGWYIADKEGRRAENVSRLKRCYMSYSEVCNQLHSGPPNEQDRRSCYRDRRSYFSLRRELTPRRDNENKDMNVNVLSNCLLSTIERLKSSQYVSSSEAQPVASSLETDSRRHQSHGHSVSTGTDARIQHSEARMLAKVTDSSIRSVKPQDLRQHSNDNENTPGDKCRRLPSNRITPDSVSKHSLIKQEAKGQRESTISLHRDSSSSIHQDHSSSGKKEHTAEKDTKKLNVSYSRQRHHEPPAESHQNCRSRTTVYTYDNNGQKISRTCYHEHAAESEEAQVQDRDYNRESAPGYGDRRKRSTSRSRWMDDRDTERHCTQRHVREDNTNTRPLSHESRQKSQDHEVEEFTRMVRRRESERRSEDSRKLDRESSPQARLGTSGCLQVGKGSEESNASLENRKQVQSTVVVSEGEDPCTKLSTENHQTVPRGESVNIGDHICNLLYQACIPGPRSKGSKRKSTKAIRQSVASTLALLEQEEEGFDKNLQELPCPGSAGEESGEHTLHRPCVGLTSAQTGEHIQQPFRRDLCVSSSGHGCTSLLPSCVSGLRGSTSSKMAAIRQSVASKLALIKQETSGFDENLQELSCPGAAGVESGEHTPHKPQVSLTSPQSGEHIPQTFKRDLCASDSDRPNQRTSSSDKAIGDFDAAKQNMSSTDKEGIGCDEQRHNLSLPNQNGKFSDGQNEQRHSRLSVTADKSQMHGSDKRLCSSSSLRDPNSGFDNGAKHDCVNSSRFSGNGASIQGRGRVSYRKHHLSNDVSPIEPVMKRQKTLSTDELNLTRLQITSANSGITEVNKPAQPLFHSVELRPTHGEPFLKNTSSLAQGVEEERTFNYYNDIGAVRCADKTLEHKLLFPGKITSDTATCTNDMTFEMAHSSPRYSGPHDKLEYFTTDF